MKRTISAILAALLLTGCADSLDSSAPEVTTSAAEQTTSAPQTTTQTEQAEIIPAEPVDTVTPPTAKDELLQLIRNRITEDDPNASPVLSAIFFEDFDGDGSRELIAADGGMEIYDEKAYYYGGLWHISEDEIYPHPLRDSDSSALTDFKRLTADGDNLFSYELYSDAEYNRTELWKYNVRSERFNKVSINGTASLHITQTEDCEFTAFSTGYGANTDGTGRIYLPYELHYDSTNCRLVQYRYREITFDEFHEHTNYCGKSILYMIAANGNNINSYYLSENNNIVINYTVGDQLRYAIGINLAIDMNENNLGNYPVDITFEQQRLEQLILDSIPEEKQISDGEIVYSLFGDLDGDGTEEIVSAYTNAGGINDLWCYIWFASGDTVEFVGSGAVGDTITTPDGTFLYFPRVGPMGTVYDLLYIHDSRIYNAMPDGGMNYIYYDKESGCYLAERSGFYDNEESGMLEQYHWDYRMSFDHESKKLVFTDIVETKTIISP